MLGETVRPGVEFSGDPVEIGLHVNFLTEDHPFFVSFSEFWDGATLVIHVSHRAVAVQIEPYFLTPQFFFETNCDSVETIKFTVGGREAHDL